MEFPASVITLSTLAKQISSVVRHVFGPERFWVTAEIIGLKVSRGHCYLQLAEKDENTITPKSEFRGIIWADNFHFLQERFEKETGGTLREQLQVLCCVEVQFHERYGLSLIIHDLDPSFTLGQLEMDRRKTIERLRNDGIFEMNRERILPQVIKNIAVISAEDSRGYEDFIKCLTDNPYGYKFNVKLYPSLLQGNMAAADIITKLISIYDHLPVQPFDAVLIVRGGGAASSLGCFNDYQLSRAVARFPLPVIAGIGHTANRSVVDEVANTSLITPTDAAVFLINRMNNFENEIDILWQRFSDLLGDKIADEKSFLDHAGSSLGNNSKLAFADEKQQLESLLLRYKHTSAQTISFEDAELKMALMKIQSSVQYYSDMESRELEFKSKALTKSVKEFIAKAEEKINLKETKLKSLDPANVLKRGFSYTLKNGKMIKDSAQLKTGEEVISVFSKGEIKSTITTINNG